MPEHRVVFLGASNLARGFQPIVDVTRRRFGDPVEIVFALGHGRSFGCTSSVLGRQLPSIIDCRLWTELARRRSAPTTGVVTDIGNDLLYMRSPQRIIQWVETVVTRLKQMEAKIFISTLPLDSLQRLSTLKFYLLRSVLFPRSKLTFDDAQARILELDDLLRQVADAHGATLFGHAPEYYGFDPIHVRRTAIPRAWSEMLALTGSDTEVDGCEPMRLATPRPRYRRLCGMHQRRRQPMFQLNSGTTIAVY